MKTKLIFIKKVHKGDAHYHDRKDIEGTVRRGVIDEVWDDGDVGLELLEARSIGGDKCCFYVADAYYL